MLTIPGAGEDASAHGDLDITGAVVVLGQNATVDAGGMEYAFDMRHPAGVSELLDLNITGADLAGVRTGPATTSIIDTELDANSVGVRHSAGSLFLWSSTITASSGPGLEVVGGNVQLQNATLSGNAGPGLSASSGVTTLIHTTVTNNAGGIVTAGGTVSVRGSIVSEQASGADCSGSLTSENHNLDSDGSCAWSGADDDTRSTARLSALASNGGPVRTHLPEFSSPALNRAGTAGCTTGQIDARGVARPSNSTCDKGAVEVSLVGADCQPLNLIPGAQLQNCDLRNANLALADLSGADLSGADLRGASLVLTDLTGATADGAQFDAANLTDADLSAVSAGGTSFAEAILLRTNLSSAQLGDAVLDHVIGTSLTTTPSSLPSGWAILRQRFFGVGVDLSGLDLSGLDLSNLDLREATLDDSTLDGTNVTGTQLAGATVNGIVGKNLVGLPASMPTDYFVTSGWIVGPDLVIVGGLFNYADFTGVDFSGRNLTGITFGDFTRITNADFTGADLSYAVLDGVTASNADLTGATMWRLRGLEVNGEPVLPSGWVRSTRLLFGPGVEIDGVTKGTIVVVSNADLTDALITNNDMDLHIHSSTLIRTDFTGTHVHNGHLEIIDSDATDAVFVDVEFQKFTTAILRGSDFSGATFENAQGPFVFNDNIIDGTNFAGASLVALPSWVPHHYTTGWGLTGVPINLPATHTLDSGFLLPVSGDAELLGDASGVDFSGHTIDATWVDATLVGTNFSGSTVGGFEGSDLTNASFIDARVSVIDESELTGADFTGADLRDIDGRDNTGSPAVLPAGVGMHAGLIVGPTALLTGDDLGGTTLTGVDFTQAQLDGANLNGAVYPLGDLRGATLSGADLTAANLLGTRIDGVDFAGATWSGTTCPDGSNTDTNGTGTCVGHDPVDRWDVILDPAGAALPLAGAAFTLGDTLPDPRLVFVSGTTILDGPPNNGVDWYIDGVLFRDDDHNAPFQISAMPALPTGVSFSGQGPNGSGNTFILAAGVHRIEAVAVTPSGEMTFGATFRIDEPS